MPELVEAPVWLELRGVPPHFFNQESLEHVAGLVGDPLYLHPATANMTNLDVAKVFTVVNLTKPLPEAVNARFQSGEIVRVGVSCPWLPPNCSFCKETGHTIKRCPTAPITCISCKTTTHDTADCPRAKKSATHEEPLVGDGGVNSELKKKRKKKKKVTKTEKMKKPTTPIPDPKDYLADPVESTLKKSKKRISKKNGKAVISSSGSELSSSSSESGGSEHQHESSSSESATDEESDPCDSTPVVTEFTKVLTKSQKRKLKKRMGKHPHLNPI
ncbi:hypothetical protein BRARA_E01918 [Brassica rapa]|uniref:CCHC-type domain-containing protein n=1 Tax=Brassica campestris TaxID=3711 RepID=A0A397ZIJ1_BRACM|nr:uncharacterized protein LOC103868762 [Brassica rapa]RID62876.1 hypothetical protein BRARA_E01918 [Brassica rapa]